MVKPTLMTVRPEVRLGQLYLGAKDEPSNPFKNPRKSAPAPNSRAGKSGRKGSDSRRSTGPPAPPGKTSKAPPAAPSGTAKKPATPKRSTSKTPARAGKSVGLRKQGKVSKTDLEKKTDLRARELIEASRTKVADAQSQRAEKMKSAKSEPSNPFKKTQAPRPASQPRRGGRFNKRNKPQGPTKRVKKLHRGKYMEFKYDVRRILDEENVEDEHRSNVLGQTWAKGERQGVEEAKKFLDGKVSDNIITEACAKRITKLIDSLTTRR